MKTLTNPRTTISTDGKTATIVVDIEDLQFNAMLTTRVSHGHLHPEHMAHPRRIQSSNAAVFLESPGAKVAITNDTLAAIISVIEPRTSFAPVFKKSSVPGNVKVVSETPVTFQWQISDNAFPEGIYPPPVAVWSNIDGATAETLDESKVPVGKWIRCIATNATGSTITKPAKKE